MTRAATWFCMGLCGGMGFHLAQAMLAWIGGLINRGG